MESFILGVILTAFISVPLCLSLGKRWERKRFEQVGTAMDQAAQRHKEAMDRRDKKLEFVRDCVGELEAVSKSKDILPFCERQADIQ